MYLIRAISRATAAYLGAVVFGYGYLSLIPPLSSRTMDTLVAWTLVGAGAVIAFVVEDRIVAMVRAWRAKAPARESEETPAEAYVTG